MNLVYLGTPEMAVPPLRALVEAGHDVVRVITRVDTRRGRGGALSPSPVKAAALELGLTVGHDPDDVLD
ncbi:MAG: methionyl-tRNA formyltransferase, partial [Actinomycetota bacterium]